MTTLGEMLEQATQLLQPVSDSARLDAELLIAEALQIPRSVFFSQPEQALNAQQLEWVQQLVARRAQGEPIAYILGSKHFWDIELHVTANTLIPRPETELLVETALAVFDAEQPIEVIDLGTGSGAIAIAIARARPHWRVTATDVSVAALDIARQNAQGYTLGNIRFVHSHWFDAIDNAIKFDLIVSNPPYIAAGDPHLQQGDVRFEPLQALQSGADGLDAIRAILRDGREHLTSNAWLMFEHGYDQAHAVRDLLREHGYTHIEQKQDLAGHVRMSMGRYTAE